MTEPRQGLRLMTNEWRPSPMDLLTIIVMVVGLGTMYGSMNARAQATDEWQKQVQPIIATIPRIEERLAANERGDQQDREAIRDNLSDIKGELRQLRADLVAERRRP